jgi:hypothetical protein
MTESSGPLAPPNLGSVISAADIDTKGTGTYSADYINWARAAQLLREHAPGWQFHLRPTAEGRHVWEAPNGTGYVVGYFEGPGAALTPDFPQAVMDNHNAAVPLAKIDARDLTDTHRRCLCTAAAASFGLAWQLWAKEPVENPHRDEPRAASEPAANAPAARQAPPTRQATTRPQQAARPQQETAGGAQPTTAATASLRCQQAGLTEAGIRAMATEISKGATVAIAGLSEATQHKLATAVLPQDWVQKYNAAGAALTDDDDSDLPRTWDPPAAA